MDFLKRLWNEEEGQGLVEYGLLMLVVVGMVIAALTVFRPQLTTLFTNVSAKITGAEAAIGTD